VAENDLECKSEVDRYLLDVCELDIIYFDILTWWKVNAQKYPTLAEIARDVLPSIFSLLTLSPPLATEDMYWIPLGVHCLYLLLMH
jgi:hypothetical protein